MSTVKFKRSGVKDKKPLASQLSLGQIAINFNDENPFISTLTNEGNVVEFPSKKGIQGLIDDALEEYQPGGTVDAYTKTETDQLLAGKSDSGHTHPQYLTEHQDISNLATKDELAGKSDSGHTHPQYLTEHQDISGKADKSELNNYLTTSAASSTYATKTDLNGKADSVHSHSYNDLTDKPVIPSTEGFATKQELGNYQPQSGMTSYLTIAQAEQDLQPKGNYLTEHQDISGKADKTDLENYQLVSAMTAYASSSHTHTSSDITDLNSVLAGYSTSSHTHPQYVTSGDVEEMLSEYTPTGSTGNVWHGTYVEYVALAEKDDDTLYCITDVSQQYMTRGEADALYMPQSGMSGYVTTSAATATYATKTELSGYARVISISQSDYDTLVSNNQVQQGVLYCIIETSN